MKETICKLYSSNIDELKSLLKLMSVISLTQVLLFLPFTSSVIIIGHVGQYDMNAVGVGVAIFHIFVVSLINGLSTAFDTIFSQVNGSEEKSSLRILVQRALIITLLSNVISATILVHTYSLAKLFGQTEIIARKSHNFILVCLPGMFGYSCLIVELKYLQAQKLVHHAALAGILVNVVHCLYGWALAVWFELGSTGIGIAISLTYWTWALILLVYIKISKVYKESWSGISMSRFENWKSILVLGIPGSLMMMSQSIGIQLHIMLAGILGSSQLTTFLIAYHVLCFTYYIGCGASIAATIQIGNYLGREHHQLARLSALNAMFIALLFPFIISMVILCSHVYIPYIFISDESMIIQTRHLLPAACLSMFLDNLYIIMTGIVRSCGKHVFVFIIDITCLCLIMTPLAVYLLFWTPIGVVGSMFAMICNTFILLVLVTIKFVQLDWELEATRRFKVNSTNGGPNNNAIEKDENSQLINQRGFKMFKLKFIWILGFVITFTVSLTLSLLYTGPR